MTCLESPATAVVLFGGVYFWEDLGTLGDGCSGWSWETIAWQGAGKPLVVGGPRLAAFLGPDGAADRTRTTRTGQTMELINEGGAWIPRQEAESSRHINTIRLERELMEMRLRIARLERELGLRNDYAGCDPAELDIDIRTSAYWDYVRARVAA